MLARPTAASPAIWLKVNMAWQSIFLAAAASVLHPDSPKQKPATYSVASNEMILHTCELHRNCQKDLHTFRSKRTIVNIDLRSRKSELIAESESFITGIYDKCIPMAIGTFSCHAGGLTQNLVRETIRSYNGIEMNNSFSTEVRGSHTYRGQLEHAWTSPW